MTTDGAAKLAIGAYQVACRLEDHSSGYLVHRLGGPEAVLHALHLVEPADQGLAEAARELARFGALSHPALPRLVEVFEHEGRLALVFERADGLRLDRLKGYLDRDRERLPDGAVWQVGWRTLGALAQAHLARDEQGALAPFVHGTLSPRDILVTWEGEVLVDGLCPFLLSHGSPDQGAESLPAGIWLAPEVRRGDQSTAKSDAYSVAMILRSLLTGRPPQAPGVSIRPLAVARPDLPSDVTHALDRALDPAPRLRPSCAELSQRLAGLARMANGQVALREGMELYQALWGLWSVAAPEVWSQEEPFVPARERPAAESDEDGSSVPWDSVPARDSTVELDWDDVENAPRTSRSPGQGKAAGAPDPGEAAAGDEEADRRSDNASLPSGAGAEIPTYSQPTADGVPVEVEALPSEEGELGEEPGAEEAGAADEGERGAEPTAPAVGASLPVDESPLAEPAAPVSSGPPPFSDGPLSPPHAGPASGGWGRWLAMGALAIAASVAAWHTLRPEPNGPPPGGASPSAAAPTTTRAAGSATTAPSPTAGPPTGAAGARPGASLGAGPEPGAAAGDGAATVPPGELLSFQGYLTVKSSVDAEVYVKGVSIGPTNRRNVSHCRQKFVRLGTPPGPRWLSHGQTVSVPCRGETTVSIEPDAGPAP